MNKLTDFMTKRKKDKRQSLMIDNFNYQQTKEQFETDTTDQDQDHFKRNGTILRRKSLDLSEEDDKVWRRNKIESFSESSKEKEEKEDMDEPWKDQSVYSDESEMSIVNKHIQKFQVPIQVKQTHKTKNVTHDCYKCKNGGNKNDPFMILNCGHIFHIGCLVEIHFDEFTNCGGIIDERFIKNCTCMVCNEQMEVEDIVHMHNKFTKSTKEQLKYQSDQIDILDKQMSKLKDEMRVQLEYKQRLEDKRNKSKQITITLNNLL
jgi:hypothetical protein